MRKQCGEGLKRIFSLGVNYYMELLCGISYNSYNYPELYYYLHHLKEIYNKQGIGFGNIIFHILGIITCLMYFINQLHMFYIERTFGLEKIIAYSSLLYIQTLIFGTILLLN